MKTIGWLQIFSKRYGGVIYQDQVKEILAKDYEFEIFNLESRYFKKFRYLRIPESFLYLFSFKGRKDLWMMDFYSVVALNKKRVQGKDLALLFHIDFSGFPLISRFPFWLAEKLFFYRKLRKVDNIVVISEYWKNYFLNRGYKNIHKIYCGFNLSEFNITDDEVAEFKKRNNLDGKQIIYLGNCQKSKGVVDSYGALSGLDAHFVTSGREDVKIPALNLDLNYRGYLTLLRASAVALTMSKFKEGWCMTAHEAMLSKTPVIGSGKGGMKELLEGGGQIICEDFRQLKKEVELLLNNPDLRKDLGEKGFKYARNFSDERFNKSWEDLLRKIL